MKRVVAVLLALVLGAHLLVGLRQTSRVLHIDEAQYLHGAWLQSQGKRLYRDFWEDHSPFLYPLLRAVAPSQAAPPQFPLLDVPGFASRARALILATGLGLLGCLSLLAWRASGTHVAALVTVLALAGSERSLFRGLLDVRNDPPTLLLFWLGVLLLYPRDESRRGAVLKGLGFGSVVIALLWNPKWPVATLVLGVVYLATLWKLRQRSTRFVYWSLGSALLLALAGVGVVLAHASLPDYLFFVYRFNAGFVQWFGSSSVVGTLFAGSGAFAHCALLFRPPWPLFASGLVAAALLHPRVRRAWVGIDPKLVGLILSLQGASLVEILLVYPFPRLWAQHYLAWSCSSALIYGCVPAALVAFAQVYAKGSLLTARSVSGTYAVVAALGSVFYLAATWPRLSQPRSVGYFADLSHLQRELRHGETVWLPGTRHPIGVHDASYYWFSSGDVVPYSIWYASEHPQEKRLPPVTEDDLPICELLAGRAPGLRFVPAPSAFQGLPRTDECFRELVRLGRLRPSRAKGVFDVVP